MRYSLDLIHIITKPVVEPAFLQDWLYFLSQEQDFAVHLLYAPDAFEVDGSELALRFPGIELHRIEKVSPHPGQKQPLVLLADTLDLAYLGRTITPAIVHSHDTRSLLLSRIFFPEAPRLHSWWLEDRTAHRLWRVLVERLAGWRTWETVEDEYEQVGSPLKPSSTRQYPLPTPVTFEAEPSRGSAFLTMREIYRTILKGTDLRAKVL